MRPLRGRHRLFLFDSPGPARPRTLRSLLPRGKSNQKRARTNGSGLLSRGRPLGVHLGGGGKGCAAGFLVRRSLRICSTPSAALVLVEVRLPAFQRDTAVQGALVLTGPACKFAPSPPDPRAECREATSTINRTVCRSRDRHRPTARTIDWKSTGRSVTNSPRNSGRSLGNVVS